MSGYLSVLQALASAFSVVIWPCLLAILPLAIVLTSAPPLTDDPKEPRMNLIAKSRAGLALSPFERALLKLGQSLLVAFGVAVAPVVADALSSHAAVDWASTLHNAALLGAAAVCMALVKYFKAQGDSPMLSAVEDVLTNAAASLTHEAGLNEPVVEPPTDPTPTPEPPTNDPSAAALKAA